MALEPLFEAELEYRDGLAPIVSPASREGELIGSGEGTARGQLNGRLRWSMFAGDCPLLPGHIDAGADGDHVCTTNPAFVLETEDGATIWFDARGYGFRRHNQEPPWVLTASLRFQTGDERYAWLNRTSAVWEGVFDEVTRQAWYEARVQTAAAERR